MTALVIPLSSRHPRESGGAGPSGRILSRIAFLAVAVTGLLFAAAGISQAQLAARGLTVSSPDGLVKAAFASNETIALSQAVYNGSESGDRIRFRFKIYAPSGKQVLEHYGNSVRGTAGNAAARISGIPIERFFRAPGLYRVTATASLDGIDIDQTGTFTVSSPDVLLIYPPCGTREIMDRPLTFRWYASGGVRYRVRVARNDPSFAIAPYVGVTAAGETFWSYPEDPEDRFKLSSDETYFWKVESLDSDGNILGQSVSACTFSVKTGEGARDLAVTGLQVLGGGGGPGIFAFEVTVTNQGQTLETEVPVRFSVGGIPGMPESKTLTLVSGGSGVLSFTGTIPQGSVESLAIACVQMFDGNVANNCRTLRIKASDQASELGLVGGGVRNCDALPPLQVCEAIKAFMMSCGWLDKGDDWSCVSVEGDEPCEFLAAMQESCGNIFFVPQPVILPGLEEQFGLPGPEEEPPTGAPAMEAPKVIEVHKEWTGFGNAFGDQATPLTVRGNKAWTRLWKALRGDKVPKVDFEKHMVIGVVAGAGDKAGITEIVSVEADDKGIMVKYRVAGPEAEESDPVKRARVPYHMKTIPATGVKISFEQVE